MVANKFQIEKLYCSKIQENSRLFSSLVCIAAFQYKKIIKDSVIRTTAVLSKSILLREKNLNIQSNTTAIGYDTNTNAEYNFFWFFIAGSPLSIYLLYCILINLFDGSGEFAWSSERDVILFSAVKISQSPCLLTSCANINT